MPTPLLQEALQLGSYRQMQLLNEISKSPAATQRELAKELGIALGLANSLLHHLALTKHLKVIPSKKRKIRYLLTPLGVLEKDRLTRNFISATMELYQGLRRLLQEELSFLQESTPPRVVLYGTDSLSEITCLTLQEMGLKLVAIAHEDPPANRFLGYPVKRASDLRSSEYDRFLIVSLARQPGMVQKLVGQGVSFDRILCVALLERPNTSVPAEDSLASASLRGPVPSEVDCVVLCGGKGTRLGSLTAQVPKPLLPVDGSPFLLRLLLHLEQEGFTRFILATQYLAEEFEPFLNAYRELLPDVELVVESEPLGTGGAIRRAADQVRSSTFVVVNGDSWVSQSVAPVLEEHHESHRAFTVIAVPASHVEGGALQKGVWRVGPRGDVIGFASEEKVTEGWVNAGIYILEKSFVSSWPEGSYSLEENLPSLLNGKEAGIFCSMGRLLDIGTPQTYERASSMLKSSQQWIDILQMSPSG